MNNDDQQKLNSRLAVTSCAPAQRATANTIEAQQERVARAPFIQPIFDSLPIAVALLNRERQVVAANHGLVKLAGKSSSRSIVGLRIGEVLACQNAEGTNGCGTNEGCRHCGAVHAMLESQEGKQATGECRIIADGGETQYELQVTATPFEVEGEPFTLFAVEDQSHEKRRKTLERIFFHDIANAATAITGAVQYLATESEGNQLEAVKDMRTAAARLMSEITRQRELLAAESSDLKVSLTEIQTEHFLRDQCVINKQLPAAKGRCLVTCPETANVRMSVDAALLGRVIGNMVANALEACPDDATVTIGCLEVGAMVEFWVHNPGSMPRSVELQIFQRSFSTKGDGRGLGTYSMKLLSERYLGGTVSFETSERAGTVFYARLPQAGSHQTAAVVRG